MPLRPPAGYIRPGYNPLQVANAPTVGTASAGDTTASVAFTAPSNVGGGAISLYYAVSSPGQFTGTSVTSPVTVTGLTNGTSYTFTVWAANPFGPSPYSASSNSVTPSFTYIEDVFSTYLYTGNGSTQTITNGVDLSTKGGLVWLKYRSGSTGSTYHHVYDSARGKSGFSSYNYLYPNDTSAQGSGSSGPTSFNSDGFSLNSYLNASTIPYVSWTFRKQPKFFDVVTWTGDGNASKTISHSLGSVPGCIITKSSSGVNNWQTYHRSLGNTQAVQLNLTNAASTNSGFWNNTSPTSTEFTVGTVENASGQTYVAYLFAHNAGGFGLTGTDNVISCGSFTGNASANGPVVNLGFEPQWLLLKNASYSTANWILYDNMRGWPVGSNSNLLYPNTSDAEVNASWANIDILPTGFQVKTSDAWINGNVAGDTMIYIAIRRGPMKTPTTGTSVFAPYVTSSLNNLYNAGFVTDWVLQRYAANTDGWYTGPRLTGGSTGGYYMKTESTAAEVFSSAGRWDSNTGAWNFNANYGLYMFRRAPGFFDVVCYTGTSVARTINHNLGVVPEMMIVKNRTLDGNWLVYHVAMGNTKYFRMNTSDAVLTATIWNDTTPTSTVFSLGSGGTENGNTYNYVWYGFASCPGVSKVGSYTGTGALQTINCGFTGGARFVLIKRTDSTGDWFVYDSARGISSGNDPYLLLNSTAAEVTGTNYVDTTSVGFQVTAAAPAGLNASGGTYIYLAIA